MDKELSIALIIAIFFLLIFSNIPHDWYKIGDFNFHLEKARDNCAQGYDQDKCDTYYPLLHLFGSLFSFSTIAFYNFLIILIVFITPMLLFFATRKAISVWLYYATTQYVYLVQSGGAYPQALAGIFLLAFLLTKNPLIRFGLLIFSIPAHSQAFVLLLIVWLVQLFFDNLGSLKNFFPACSAIFGKQADDPIGAKVTVDVLNKHGVQNLHVFVKDIANFFVRTFPFPFLIAAFWQLKKERDWAIIVLTALFFYYGFAVAQPRIFLMVPLLLIPSLTRFYTGISCKWKKLFLVLTGITFLLNFGTWILYKINCL